MSISLLTQPQFLRSHFPRTRRGLLGDWTGKPAKTSFSEALPEIPGVIGVPLASKSEELPYLPVQHDVIPVPRPVHETEQTNVQAPARTEDFVTSGKTVAEDRKATSIWKSITRFMLTVIIVLSVAVAAVLIIPEIYYTFFADSQTNAYTEVADNAKAASAEQPKPSLEPEPYMPPKNPELPTGTWVNIPRIEVYSEALATENPDEALDTGVWMVPDFGRPGDQELPTIMAAHRYGWDWWWQSDYWKYNSFYLLTETEPGDTVEIIYDQRRWVYEIYASEEGELITDYDADLILYTCKHLNSPIRHFRYAKLVVPDSE